MIANGNLILQHVLQIKNKIMKHINVSVKIVGFLVLKFVRMSGI